MQIQLEKGKKYHLYLDESLTGRRFHLIACFVDSADSLLQFYDIMNQEAFLISRDKIKYCYPVNEKGAEKYASQK